MRLDAVELKANVDDAHVDTAIARLKLASGKQREVRFLEDASAGLLPPTPLLDMGLVMRVRYDGDSLSSTIKFRPGRRSQLSERWLERSTRGVRVEEDWTLKSRVLAISF